MNRLCAGRLGLASLATVIVCALTAVSADAATRAAPTLSFPGDSTLTLRWGDLVGGHQIEVCNTGGDPGKDSSIVRAVDFGFRVGGTAVEDSDVLTVSPAKLAVPAGQCAPVTLGQGGATPDAGDYNGQIVLRSKIAIASLAVIVSSPPANATLPVAAIDEVDLHASRSGPWDHTIGLASPSSIPLSTSSGGRIDVPSPGTLIGVLQNGRYRARVYVDGALFDDHRVPNLPTRIDAPRKVGTYAGAVDISGDPTATAPVKLSVVASDSPWNAVPVVLIGTLLAALALLLAQRCSPIRGLARRRKNISTSYEQAKAKFDQAASGAFFVGYAPDTAKIDEYTAKVGASIMRLEQDNWLVDTTGADYKAVTGMLQTAKDDAGVFGEKLAPRLKELEDSVASFPSPPRFVTRAAGLLQAQPLPVGGATEVVRAIDAYASFEKRWRELAGRLARLRSWAAELRAVGGLPAADAAVIDAAELRLQEADQELFEALDPGSLTETGTADKLHEVYAELCPLGARHGKWLPSEAAGPGPGAESLAFANAEGPAWFASGNGFPPLIEGAVIRILASSERGIAEVVALGVALVAGVAAMVPIVINGDVFGTWRDYIVAFSTGLASTALVKGLFDTADKFRADGSS